MRLLFSILLTIAAATATKAQCYDAFRQNGIELYNKGDYSGAKRNFEKAAGCNDTPAQNDLASWKKKAQTKIWENSDDDGDGILNKNDKCPNQKGTAQHNGCPPPKKKDAVDSTKILRDQADDDLWDIIKDGENRQQFEKYKQKYCPGGRHCSAAQTKINELSDSDNDGIINKNDRCPDQKGTTADNGCPPPKTVEPQKPARKSGFQMIEVTGGTFTMGSPSNESERDDDECQHQRTVANFKIGKYEITQADWREIMQSDPPQLHNKGCDQCPVERVSWDDIQDFLKKVEAKTGKKYRLPTEAEWEFAARGGNQSKKYIYAGGNSLTEVAWYGSNSDSKTHPVGTKNANELGIHDMSGNVWEWCFDTYKPYPCDSKNEADGSRRCLRGGSWSDSARVCRVANRGVIVASNRNYGVGFRLAQD